MSDYYSYKPLVRLSHPLVLLGLPGTQLTAVVKMLGSFSGVRPILTDRLLGHELGFLPDKYTAQQEHEARWEAEQDVLTRQLSDGPGLIAFSSWSVVHQPALPWLKDRAEVVYLREPPEVVVDRVTADVAEDPKTHWLLAQGNAVDPKRLFPTLAAHDAVLSRAGRVLAADGVQSHAIAFGLLGPLGLDPEG